MAIVHSPSLSWSHALPGVGLSNQPHLVWGFEDAAAKHAFAAVHRAQIAKSVTLRVRMSRRKLDFWLTRLSNNPDFSKAAEALNLL